MVSRPASSSVHVTPVPHSPLATVLSAIIPPALLSEGVTSDDETESVGETDLSPALEKAKNGTLIAVRPTTAANATGSSLDFLKNLRVGAFILQTASPCEFF